MNALRSLDKAQGIKGKSEEEWIMNLKNYFQYEATINFDKIKELVLS